MRAHLKKNFGFTLIELLVVISIISLLSSIIFTVLDDTKSKAKDVAVKAGAREFEKLFQMEYNDTGSYLNLEKWWISSSSSCNSAGFGGTYASQALSICKNIFANAAPRSGGSVFFGPFPKDSQKYAIEAYLSTGHWFCVGSSGTSNNVDYWISTLNGDDISSIPRRWSEAPIGCNYNP